MPLSGELDLYGARVQGGSPLPADQDQSALRYAVTPGYAEAMRIRIRQGRWFSARDVADAPPVAVVSAGFARHRLAGRDPLGERVQLGPATAPWFTVVGIADDVKQTSLAAADRDAVYVPSAQWQPFADRAMWLVVHTPGDPAALERSIRRAVWSVDRQQPIVKVATMSERLAASAATERFVMTMFEVFALSALALATIGI